MLLACYLLGFQVADFFGMATPVLTQYLDLED
jgi:hypothetical protein